jgi:hypothetical protein
MTSDAQELPRGWRKNSRISSNSSNPQICAKTNDRRRGDLALVRDSGGSADDKIQRIHRLAVEAEAAFAAGWAPLKRSRDAVLAGVASAGDLQGNAVRVLIASPD